MIIENVIREMLVEAGVENVSPFDRTPQSQSVPFATIQQITKTAHRHMNGSSNLREVLLQVNLYHSNRSALKLLARTVEDALDNFKGDKTFNAETVGVRVYLMDETDLETNPSDGSPAGPAGVAQTYSVWFKEE